MRLPITLSRFFRTRRVDGGSPERGDARTPPDIQVAQGSENNGFAGMLAQLLRQNLVDHPHKTRDLTRLLGRVAILVEDAGVAVTLHFRAGSLRIHDGIVGIPDLTLRATAADVTAMSLVELVPRLGLPDLRKEHARAVFEAQRTGRVRMFGAYQNLPMVLRLTRLMSVHR